jgi:hypothetical protein
MIERVAATSGVAFDMAQLATSTSPDPLGEQMVPTTGLYRVSGALPFTRLIMQSERAVSPWWLWLLRGWRTNRLSKGETSINESVHGSAIARLGRMVKVRRGDAVTVEEYRPRNLLSASG